MARASAASSTPPSKEAGAIEKKPTLRTLPAYWDPYHGGCYQPEYEVPTGVPAEELARAHRARSPRWPEGFHVHEKIKKLLEQRARDGAAASGRSTTAWPRRSPSPRCSTQGVPVRLTGQDSRRGTFNQRHAVLIDVENGGEHMPLAAPGARTRRASRSTTRRSPRPRSSASSTASAATIPEALVLWEAQFGDFANGAQIIIDQFVTAGEDKWGLLSGLVLLLPHGYEGQGPEHSSARIERYLQLAAEDNIQVCQPSTAAQYFHLLRRQALRPWRKPLVVMTPKSMLRAQGLRLAARRARARPAS